MSVKYDLDLIEYSGEHLSEERKLRAELEEVTARAMFTELRLFLPLFPLKSDLHKFNLLLIQR